MPRLIVFVLSLILGAGTAVLVSCGGDDGPDVGIPSTDADGMLAELDRARANLEAGNCAEVEESATQLQEAAANLETKGVDAEVADGIDQGAARLAELATDPSQCEQTTTQETTEETEPTTTEEPTTTTETTTTEETTTTDTEEEKPPPTPPGQEGEPPPGQQGPAENGTDTGTGGTGDGERSAKQAKHDKKAKKAKKD